MPRASAPKTPPRKLYLPRVSPSPTTHAGMKPEDTDHGTPNSLPQTHTDAGARKWTNADYVELLDYVIESSKISFENAVPGRTRNQAYQAWRNVARPYITHALSTKDSGVVPATLARTPAQVKRKATRNSIAAKQEHTTDMDMEVDARYDTYGGAEQKPKGSPADE